MTEACSKLAHYLANYIIAPDWKVRNDLDAIEVEQLELTIKELELYLSVAKTALEEIRGSDER